MIKFKKKITKEVAIVEPEEVKQAIDQQLDGFIAGNYKTITLKRVHKQLKVECVYADEKEA